MNKTSILAFGSFVALISSCRKSVDTPVTPTSTTFNLTLAKSTKQLRTGAVTTTYGYNGASFWGPTLLMNKGDFVKLNVTNNLSEATTTHWHGFHIPAIMDGGPHQLIAAGTYWYHPHLHEKTKEQLTYGAGGLIIIKDPIESALALPRTYGIVSVESCMPVSHL